MIQRTYHSKRQAASCPLAATIMLTHLLCQAYPPPTWHMGQQVAASPASALLTYWPYSAPLRTTICAADTTKRPRRMMWYSLTTRYSTDRELAIAWLTVALPR